MNKEEKSKDNFLKDNPVMSKFYPAEGLSEKDALNLAQQLDKKVKNNKGKISFLKHIFALKKYMFDKDVKWYKKSIVIATLIYFISPIDAIPDFSPFVGYLDDLGVIAWTIKFLGSELSDYY
jgi:uncharacterized membrane protein YkvA (DUF1232 family)